MTDELDDAPEPRPPDLPGERPPAARRLERPPAERYAQAESPAADCRRPFARPGGWLDRARGGIRGPAAVIAVLIYVALAGPFAFSAGLVIIGIFAGRVIGLSAKVGGGRAITSDQAVVVALLVTIAWFVVAQVATWLYARNEGGVLPIVDYLLQTFGPVVPLVAIASILPRGGAPADARRADRIPRSDGGRSRGLARLVREWWDERPPRLERLWFRPPRRRRRRSARPPRHGWSRWLGLPERGGAAAATASAAAASARNCGAAGRRR